MPISAMPCVSIRCDGCGRGHDEEYTTPKQEMENLKVYGWTGTYKKCYCPVCSKDRAVKPVTHIRRREKWIHDRL